MGKPILLLRLEGPLQSWGVRSRWSKRDTGPEPTKSAIIGMLGAAGGVLRPDWRAEEEPCRILEQWDDALLFGVRVDRPGVIETDYHTVEGRFWQADGKLKTAASPSGAAPANGLIEPPRTEETWRDYIHDAAFLVALEQKDGGRGLLDQFAQALGHPKWPLFLGRKACVPSRPVLDRVSQEYEALTDALRKEKWAAPRQVAKLRCYVRQGAHKPCSTCRKFGPPDDLTAWVEDPAGDFERADALRLNQLRYYDFRPCRRLPVPSSDLEWSVP
ncbi:MAG: hypothetical protein AMXMBFR81_30600 [Chthonomonas sp.]